jgi:hypothetical protein
MSLTSKSPRKVALEALAVAEKALPLYSSKFSPRTFTQAQLFACLALKAFWKTDYRGVVAMLTDCPELAHQTLRLKKVPHFTTLQKASERLLGFGSAQELLRTSVRQYFGEQKPRVELAAADSTGLESSQISPYFVRRRAKGQKREENPQQTTTYTRYPKCELVVDCRSHLILGALAGLGPFPDNNRLPVLVWGLMTYMSVGTILADVGYDWEEAHRFCRDGCCVRSVVPPEGGRPRAANKLPGGSHRRRLGMFFDFRYGQRWQVETVASMIKRRLGAYVLGRSDAARNREVMLKVLTHNLMILAALLLELFYRALPSLFFSVPLLLLKLTFP